MGLKGIRTIFFKQSSSNFSAASHSSSMGRTFSMTLTQENIHRAESFIAKWDLEGSNPAYLFPDHREEAREYMDSIRELQNSMHRLVEEDPHSELLVRAHCLVEASMKRLAKEFHRILSTGMRFGIEAGESVSSLSSRASSPTRSRLSDYSEDESEINKSKFDGASDPVLEVGDPQGTAGNISDLKTIADCMIVSGYAKECINTYKIARKSVVEEELHNLGFETRVISSQIQKMDWEVLESKIKRWLTAVKVALKTVFYVEMILCDAIFPASASLKQSCFADVTRDSAIALFEFAEAIAKVKKSPEKIFRVLDLYEAIANLWPEIEMTFYFDSISPVRWQAVKSLIKLGEAVRSMLGDFETAIQKDSSKSAVPGGGVHPLTRYVMNYLAFLGDYSEVLGDIVADWPLELQGSLPESLSCVVRAEFEDGTPSAISTRVAWLVLVLLCKLDAKAELYKDVALSYLFLANNLRYVVVKVSNSALRDVLGDGWVVKHESKVREYASKYERIGWSKVLTSFPEKPAAEITPDQARDLVSGFNAAFEEAFARQASWVVPDPKLREEVRASLAKKLSPAYRRIYDACPVTADGDEAPGESIVKYTPEDLDNYMSELLYVSSGSGENTLSSYHSNTTSSTDSSRSSSSSTGSFPVHLMLWRRH